MAHGVVISNCC